MPVHANHADSDEAHLAVGDPIAMLFYDMGSNNNEATGKDWCKKLRRIEQDVRKVFQTHHHVQALFITESGNMFQSIDPGLANTRHGAAGRVHFCGRQASCPCHARNAQ